jgi:hypothetical protein
LTFVAVRLPPLQYQYKRKDEPIDLPRGCVGAHSVDLVGDIVEKSALDCLDRNRRAFGIVGIAQSARMDKRKM